MIGDGLNVNNMMEVEAGNELIKFGREKQSEAKKRLSHTTKETVLKVSYLRVAKLKKI